MKAYVRLLRDLRPAEVAEIAALEAANFGAGGLNQWQLPVFIRYGRVYVLETEAEREVIGAAELMTSWGEPKDVFLVGFSIKSGYRGRGLGRRLLSRLINDCREDGRRRLLLTVDKLNQPALKLYKSFGFKEARQLKDEYGFGVDRRLLILDLRKGL